jgi:sugar phosphate isomerase/epimerase
MPMQLCCSSPMVPGESLTEKAENLARWGYDAISVVQPLDTWDEHAHSELASIERRTGIRPARFVLTSPTYGHAMSPNQDLRARCRAMYRQAALICAELGAVMEIEYEYGAQDPLPLFSPYQQLNDEQRDAFLAFYGEMLLVVEGTSASILLEPLNRYECKFLNRMSDNVHVVDLVSHPNAGLLPDTFHMSLEESDMGGSLREAGHRIRHMDLADSNRLLPGRGLLDWSEIFNALHEIGYEGDLNLECCPGDDPSVELAAAAGLLRGLVSQ